ncbi:hypothetical protein PVK06_031286 [Gossypium arboreum]|uniref:Uncharacterized protein n=1 Tax=Gossypium arboreum TaxID=29729 RepID=A0ABR0NQN7_GOSAR|nr:hypothetical protein PVK06_031286 [Gossypium arboreum]
MGTYIEEIKIKEGANIVAYMIAKERISLPEDSFLVEELPVATEAFFARDLSGLTPYI